MCNADSGSSTTQASITHGMYNFIHSPRLAFLLLSILYVSFGMFMSGIERLPSFTCPVIVNLMILVAFMKL